MSTNKNAPLSLSLEPVDEVAPSRSVQSLGITTSDPYLEAAANEYQQGNLDQALWSRALTQSGNDESLAVAAYLKSRATALRLQQRSERAERPAPPPRTSTADSAGAVTRSPRRAPAPANKRAVMFAAIAAAVVAVAAIVWLAAPDEDPAPVAAAAVQPKVASATPAKAPVAANPQTIVAAPDKAAAAAYEVRHESKVEELRNAGNWNVLVLYAADWTRKDPNNSVAWIELSAGYLKLRQWGEALDAANAAARLSPGDARALENLGRVNLALERFADARAAFDAALATSPDSVDALCGALLVAQHERRAKDAAAIAGRATAIGAVCNADASAPPQTRNG